MFQLLEQIAQILQIDFPHKAALFEAIKKSSRDRDDILPALSSDVTEAKHLLIAFANGKALTEEPHLFFIDRVVQRTFRVFCCIGLGFFFGSGSTKEIKNFHSFFTLRLSTKK